MSDIKQQPQQQNIKPQKPNFFQTLTSFFGFRLKKGKTIGKDVSQNIEFVKVDIDSPNRFQHAKIGRIFKTKISNRLDELFKSWLNDTTDSYETLKDRQDRLSYIDFAITNDPYLAQAADLYADEATQLDELKGQLIDVDCSDTRMKYRILQLLDQWNITQNRIRAAIYNLAVYGDSFWAVKVTEKGVIRITPLDIYQVKERLEFNPVRLSSDLSLKKDQLYSAVNRQNAFKQLLQMIQSESQSEFSDLFDTKLFGFVLSDDLVVPPWNIVHFRLNADQSPFYPYGTSLFLKAIAPYRQLNATLALQGLARLVSFPITLYKVKTTPGMDEIQQFERVNELREEYENIGEVSTSGENYSINTKIWLPENLLTIETISPDVKIDSVGDIEILQERVSIASGIPKGYLNENWGGFGTSAVSLIEQWKPFARRVFTLQSAFLDGLSYLIRLHFAITNEFDYTTPFILSMRFPQSEAGADALKTKSDSLDLTKSVIDLIKDVLGTIDDPIPEEILQDILKKFSFLDPKDIEKWVQSKYKPKEENPEEDLFDTAGSIGGERSGAPGGAGESEKTTENPFEKPPEEEGTAPEEEGAGEETAPTEETPETAEETPEAPTGGAGGTITASMKRDRKRLLLERYQKTKYTIYEQIIKKGVLYQEFVSNNRHNKYTPIMPFEETIFKTMKFIKNPKLQEDNDRPLTWEEIKKIIPSIEDIEE